MWYLRGITFCGNLYTVLSFLALEISFMLSSSISLNQDKRWSLITDAKSIKLKAAVNILTISVMETKNYILIRLSNLYLKVRVTLYYYPEIYQSLTNKNNLVLAFKLQKPIYFLNNKFIDLYIYV